MSERRYSHWNRNVPQICRTIRFCPHHIREREHRAPGVGLWQRRRHRHDLGIDILARQGEKLRMHVPYDATYLLYDRQQGTIRVFNQNLLSKVGGPHEFTINQPSFEHYFFPTQDRDEIAETIAVFMKYY